MARKTIAGLEEEIKKLNERLNSSYKTIEKFMAENSQLRDKADDDFKDSSLYMQMKKKIKNLEMKLKVKDSTINTYKSCEDRLIKQKDEFLDEIEQLKNEIEHLKVAPEDDIKKIKYENFRLSCELRKIKELKNNNVHKDIEQNKNNIEEVKNENLDSYKRKVEILENKIDNLMRENADLKTNAAINAGDLQIKLDRAKERNKNIISDYAKCSKENEQLKKYIKELEAKQVGRPKKLNDYIVQKVIELREAKKSIREIAKELNVSVGSVHNIVHNIIEQNKAKQEEENEGF